MCWHFLFRNCHGTTCISCKCQLRVKAPGRETLHAAEYLFSLGYAASDSSGGSLQEEDFLEDMEALTNRTWHASLGMVGSVGGSVYALTRVGVDREVVSKATALLLQEE